MDSNTEAQLDAPDSPGSGDFSLSPAAAARRRRKLEEREAEILGEGGSENVQVCIRVRPFNRRELELEVQSGAQTPLRSVVEMPNGMTGTVICFEKDDEEFKFVEEFKYTKTFWSIPEDQQRHAFSPVNQLDVFEAVGIPIIKYAFAGFNNCVFAYGQTGSGKTHTMMGDFQLEETGLFGELTGIIPRLCRALFEKIEEKKSFVEDGIVKTFDVQLNAIEIYNEQVRDLFWRSTPGRTKNSILKVRMHPTQGAFVDQLSVLNPTSWRDCLRKIEKGVSERTVAATLMNDESSRSHSVFQIILTQTETIHVRSDDPDDRYSKPVTYKKVSKINLVDLAGSERLKKSGAQGQQLKEATNINQSLTTLKKVIDALVVNSKEANIKKHVLIPFRESTLTLLLSDSLGGNSKTTMVACVSPHYDNQEETLLTLRYANRTGAIVNTTRINEDTAAKQALHLKHQILELQKRLAEGPVDEEAEDLIDQIELGRSSLRDLEDANVRASKAYEDMKNQTIHEEGARLAAAFYNTLQMAVAVQQKEQVDRQLQELEESVAKAKEEVRDLRESVKSCTITELQLSSDIEKMSMDDRFKSEKDQHMERAVDQLKKDSEAMNRRFRRELEHRYAQTLANRQKMKRMQATIDTDLSRMQGDHDDKLSAIIREAAEAYELQVRQFADHETNQQHRIAALEKEISKITRDREASDAASSLLLTTLRKAERQHGGEMNKIEEEFKQKYEEMKKTHQVRIDELDRAIFEENRVRTKEIEDLYTSSSDDHQKAVIELERLILEKESQWKVKIGLAFDSHGDRLHDTIRKKEEESRLKAIVSRRECEHRVSELFGKLGRVKYLQKSHEDALALLKRVLRAMATMHDKLMEPVSKDASNELVTLKAKLRRYDGVINSVPLVASLSPSRTYGSFEAHEHSLMSDKAPLNQTVLQLSDTPGSPAASKTMAAPNAGTPDAEGAAALADGTHRSPSAAATGRELYGAQYKFAMSPIQTYNVFSQDRFNAMNALKFDHASPRREVCHHSRAAADRSPASQSAQHHTANIFTPSKTTPGKTTPSRTRPALLPEAPHAASRVDPNRQLFDGAQIQRSPVAPKFSSASPIQSQQRSSLGTAAASPSPAAAGAAHIINIPSVVTPVSRSLGTRTSRSPAVGLRSVKPR